MCCCPLVVLDFTLQLNIAYVSNIIMYFLLCPYGVNVNRLTKKKKINKQKAFFLNLLYLLIYLIFATEALLRFFKISQIFFEGLAFKKQNFCSILS